VRDPNHNHACVFELADIEVFDFNSMYRPPIYFYAHSGFTQLRWRRARMRELLIAFNKGGVYA
jgi:hypothetical protein